VGLLRTGGPIEGITDGVVSIGSRGGVSCEELVEEVRMGMDVCSGWRCESIWNALGRTSAADAIPGFVAGDYSLVGTWQTAIVVSEARSGAYVELLRVRVEERYLCRGRQQPLIP
jgi:hypothetical protein